MTLPSTGTYLLAVAGQGTAAGAVTYRFEAFQDVNPTAALTLNSEVTGTLTNPGDEATYTFTGSIGQQVQFNGLQIGSSQLVTLYDPEGIGVFSTSLQSDGGPYTLAMPGLYRLVLTTNGPNAGNYDFRLLDLASSVKLQVNTTEADLTVSLSAPATQQVLVEYSTSDGTATAAGGDYKAASGWLLFQPGETAATAEVQAIDKLTAQAATLDVNLSQPVGATIATGGGTGVVTVNPIAQGTLTGEVYNDLNGDGTPDGGEPGLAGWTIDLLDPSNAVIATAATDSTGTYAFTGVAAGSYTIAEVVQTGYVRTAPAAPGTYAVTMAVNQAINNLLFGDFRTVTLGGEVDDDLDGNGALDAGEPGLAGATLHLLDSSNQVVATATTDSNGHYAFPGVGPGSYSVQQVVPGGTLQTTSPASYSIKTESGQDVAGLTFGDFRLATFGGEVFGDADGNGALDAGESGIAGWTVNLLNVSSQLVAAATTDSGGDYSFTGVGPGAFTIQEVQQPGDTATTPTSIAATSSSGLVATANDFGEFPIPTLSGEVFNDLDGNGVLDGGETGLAGWTVDLLDGASQLVATATTDSHGGYSLRRPAPAPTPSRRGSSPAMP